MKKLRMDFWQSIGSPRHICAPMVDQSWAPFRQLVHARGCDLSYTPMAHARLIVNDEKYRKNMIEDLAASPRPVIAQLAANESKGLNRQIYLMMTLYS